MSFSEMTKDPARSGAEARTRVNGLSKPVDKVSKKPETGGMVIKNSPASAGDTGSLGQEDLLEKETATHSSILAWEIPRTEEAGGPWGCRVTCRRGKKKRSQWLFVPRNKSSPLLHVLT